MTNCITCGTGLHPERAPCGNGLPDSEIAAKVHLSRYAVTQVILGASRPPRR
jgi:hypothetical protein